MSDKAQIQALMNSLNHGEMLNVVELLEILNFISDYWYEQQQARQRGRQGQKSCRLAAEYPLMRSRSRCANC